MRRAQKSAGTGNTLYNEHMEILLDHFKLDNGAYGGSQAWFRTAWMRLGGCAAQTACDICVFFAKHFGMGYLYPFDTGEIRKKEYVTFSNIMRPYLKPRMKGINTLEIFMDGFREYLSDMEKAAPEEEVKTRILMEGFSGERSAAEAETALVQQLEKGYPAACLTLHHEDPAMEKYVWHWFLINGYRREEAGVAGTSASAHEVTQGEPCSLAEIRTVTFGEARWVGLERLWNTGREPKGGLVFFDLAESCGKQK